MIKKSITSLMRLALGVNLFFYLLAPSLSAQQQPAYLAQLPALGQMIGLSNAYTPALLKGVTVDFKDPFKFNFIVGSGEDRIEGVALERASQQLVKYFLAALTVPENEMWVNLSPFEKDRIIPPAFGLTQMGRDLLVQDYLLKQLTASLMYPEKELGNNFWKTVRERVKQKYGSVDIPTDALNKIWIVPSKATVYEHQGTAFIIESQLKVMLEADYLALMQTQKENDAKLGAHQQQPVTADVELVTQVVREILIPEIEKEVNEGKTFANLRQMYQGMILAAWYKRSLKESLLSAVYVDQNKVVGINHNDPDATQKIYNQYLEAFRQGVYDYIKEDYNPEPQQVVLRKYFSGGFVNGVYDVLKIIDEAMVFADPNLGQFVFNVSDAAMKVDNYKVSIELKQPPDDFLPTEETTSYITSTTTSIDNPTVVVVSVPTEITNSEILADVITSTETAILLSEAPDTTVNSTVPATVNSVVSAPVITSPIPAVVMGNPVTPTTLPNANERVGGINLNSTLLDLSIRKDDNGMPLPAQDQPMEIIEIPGLTPVILKITPIVDLPLLLGLDNPSLKSAQPASL